MCSLLQICVQYCIDVAYVVEIKLNSIQFNSASGMFVQCNLLSFGELLRKSIFAFRGRIQSSNNTVIKCMVNSVAPLVSNVLKWWRTTLYTGHVTV